MNNCTCLTRVNQYRRISWPTVTHHLVSIYVTLLWLSMIGVIQIYLANTALFLDVVSETIISLTRHRDSTIRYPWYRAALSWTPKLFVMGFNRIMRESMRHMLLGDGQRPIHTNLFDNSLRLWNFCSTKATYVSLYAFQHIRFIDNYDYLSGVYIYPYIVHTYSYLPRWAINRPIALYRV